MEFKIIFITLTLIFFNAVQAICVPRNGPSSSPSPKPSTPAPASPTAPSPSSSSSSSASSGGSSPSTPDQPLIKRPLLNALASALPQPGGENPAIKKICDSTDYPDVCLSTLGPFKGPGDVPAVLSAAIRAGLEFSKTALALAEKLANQPGTPPDQASLFKDCKDSYDDAQYNFEKASNALPGNDVGTMNTMLSAAITDVGDCEDAFEGTDYPLATFSEKLTKMASNCLAIISLINH